MQNIGQGKHPHGDTTIDSPEHKKSLQKEIKVFTIRSLAKEVNRRIDYRAWVAGKLGHGKQRKEFITHIAIVTTWFSLTLVLAVAVPNIEVIIKLLGSLAAVFMFIFTGLFMFRGAKRSDPAIALNRTRALIPLSIVFMGFGALLFMTIFFQTIAGLVNGND